MKMVRRGHSWKIVLPVAAAMMLSACAGAKGPGRAEPSSGTQPQEPATLGDLVAGIKAATGEGRAMVTLDAPMKFQRWNPEPWANPAKVALLEETDTGRPFILVQCEPGNRGKWVVAMTQAMDLSAYDSVSVDAKVGIPILLSVALWTDPGRVIYESKPEAVLAGGWRTLTFPLKGEGFKSQATDWQFGTAVANPADTEKISFFLYSTANQPICIRNVRARTGR